MSTPQSFGEYVATARKARGLPASGIAARLQVAPSTITRIEANTVVPTLPHFLALVQELELDIATACLLLEPYRTLYHRITTAQKGPAS